jgi:hypothetical protein
MYHTHDEKKEEKISRKYTFKCAWRFNGLLICTHSSFKSSRGGGGGEVH